MPTTNWSSDVEERTAQLVAEIDERKQAREKMREGEAQLDAYFNAFPAGMAIVDPQLRYFEGQPAAGGYERAADRGKQGKTIGEIVPQLAPILEPVFREVFATGKPILNFELSGETAASPGESPRLATCLLPSHGRGNEAQGGRDGGDRNHRAKTCRGGAELRQDGRRIGQPRQERFPRQHEP